MIIYNFEDSQVFKSTVGRLRLIYAYLCFFMFNYFNQYVFVLCFSFVLLPKHKEKNIKIHKMNH